MVCLDARSLRLELTSSDSANTQGLVNGGLAGLFWSYVWTFLGFSLIIMSLAEMASMYVAHAARWSMLIVRRAPTSGGQYHWVSEFAPPQYQKCLSYLTGTFTPRNMDGAERRRMDVHAVLAGGCCLRRLSGRNSHPGADHHQRFLVRGETLARNAAHLRRLVHRLQPQHLVCESVANVSKSIARSPHLRVHCHHCVSMGCGSSAASYGRLHPI